MKRIVTVSALVVAGFLVGVTGSSVTAAKSTTVAWNVSSRTTAAVSAKSLLTELTVKADNTSKYSRTNFKHWTDADGDGCDTRQEVLITERVSGSGPTNRSCTFTGSWKSQYDGASTTLSSSFDVDHMIPLAEAWRSGAAGWTSKTRENFANDLDFAGSLIAVTASSNRSKSDRDPAKWLPTSNSYRCTYVATWTAVKWRWKLSIDQAEKNAISATMKNCTTASLKVAGLTQANISSDTTPTTTTPTTTTPTTTPASGTTPVGNDPRYSSCAKAKAAGYGPYLQGTDPEYSWYRDADKDGIVCE